MGIWKLSKQQFLEKVVDDNGMKLFCMNEKDLTFWLSHLRKINSSFNICGYTDNPAVEYPVTLSIRCIRGWEEEVHSRGLIVNALYVHSWERGARITVTRELPRLSNDYYENPRSVSAIIYPSVRLEKLEANMPPMEDKAKEVLINLNEVELYKQELLNN